jgi:two-component system sensor histidine kinase EvgS
MLYAQNFLKPIASEITIIKVGTSEEAFSRLLNGKADIFLGLNIDYYTIANRFIVGVKSAKIFWDSTFYPYLGVRNDEPLLISALRKANASITSTEIITIQQHWLEVPLKKSSPEFTPQERAFIKQHQNIRLGVDLNFAPLEFIDKNKEHRGFTKDLLDIITEKTDLRFSPHPNWSENELHHQIQTNKLDMLSTQIVNEHQTSQPLLCSNPFMKVPLVILARKGTSHITSLKSIIHQRIGVVQNHFPEECLLGEYSNANIVPYHTLQDGLLGLSEGTCDFFLETLIQANYIIHSKGISGISLVGKTGHDIEFGFEISRDFPELQSILNKTLASIPLNQRIQLQKNLTKLTVAEHINWLPIVQIAVIALLIVLVMIVWNRRLQLEIKARKQAENSLKLAKRTLNTIPLYIFWINDQFKIDMANKAALEITGLSLKELSEKTVWDLDPSFDFNKCRATWDKVKKEKSIYYEGQLTCHDGTIIPTEESLTFLDPPDTHPHVVSICTDITIRKSQEEQLRKSGKKLKAALEKAEESSQLKSEFLSNMSHEIRTPLNAILGYSEMLETDNLPPEQQRYVTTIIKSGKTLITLINDILDLSKLEAGKIKIIPIAVNSERFFTEILNIFEPQILEKNLTLDIDLDPDLPASILIDEIRLRQVLFNIIGNAIKFTQTGSIKMAVSFTKTAQDTGSISIAISDTGIGIAEEDRQLIFQSFQQKSSGIARQYDGTGLGLTLSKRFIELMNGKILLESTMGKGSCFTIILPDIATSDTSAAPEKTTPCDLTSIHRATILITDDSQTNRDLIKACLKDTPLTILTATNGKEAVDIANKEHLDLIFMDIKMSVMSGTEAATILRSNPDTAAIPIICLSGSVPEPEVLNIFDDFLQKPFSMEIIRQKTQQFIQNSETQNPTAEPLSQEKAPLTVMENKILLEMLSSAQHTGTLTDYQIIADQLQQYGEKYNNEALKTIGSALAANTQQGAIIQIEDQLLELEKYLQEST